MNIDYTLIAKIGDLYISSSQPVEVDGKVYDVTPFEYDYTGRTIKIHDFILDKIRQGDKVDIKVVILNERNEPEFITDVFSGYVVSMIASPNKTIVKVKNKMQWLWNNTITKKEVYYKDFPTIANIENKKIIWGKNI